MPCDTVTVDGGSAGGASMNLEFIALSNPNPVEGDGPVAMDANIYNGGSQSGTAELEVKVGSWVADTVSKEIGASSTGTLTVKTDYQTLKNNVGTGDYQVTYTLLGDPNWDSQTKTKSITIGSSDGGNGGGADIDVTEVTGPANKPAPGDSVEGTVVLENTGSEGGTSNIAFTVNGNKYTTIERYIGTEDNVIEVAVEFTVPDTKAVTIIAGPESYSFNTSTETGGDEPSGGDIVDQIIGFAKDNPYAVGAGALAAGYLVVGDKGGRTIIRSRPSGRASQPRSQSGENSGRK
jgi:hypothetical protein